MTATLVLPASVADEISRTARLPLETAGVLLATVVQTSSGTTRLLGRKVRWVDPSAYIRRERDALSIASEGYVPALAEAESLGAMAIWIHTHPGERASPEPSDHDRIVDRQIADLFRVRSNSPYYGAFIFSPRSSGVAWTGRLQAEHGEVTRFDRLWTVGDSYRLTRSFDSEQAQLPPIFDRNVRAFGKAVQNTLGDLRIGIIGCGGTGSAVAEQLVRLGVRHLTLVDPDELSESNVTRVYGSTPADVGQPKVHVLAKHLNRIAPDLRCESIQAMITLEPIARRLDCCDLLFGCTDDNAGRLILSRIPTYLLTPVIDCGVLLSSDASGVLTGIDGRVTILAPGEACLICRNRVDLSRAAAELLTPEERVRRQDEGYAPALGRVEPAVVAFTTMVAAAAVGELLERLVGYGPRPRPNEVLLRMHDREVSANIAEPRDRHYCAPSAGKLGRGITQPFLDQTWPI